MSRHQRGFTLVELIVVIVILGILAATALPRFIDVTGSARTAAVQGFAGGLRSGAGMVQARFFASGTGTSPVTMADTTTVIVTTTTGLPTGVAAGIGNAIGGTGGCVAGAGACQGFTADFTTNTAVTFRPTNGGSATCQASYNDTNGVVTVTTTTC